MNWKQFLKPNWKKIFVFILTLNFLLIPFTCMVAKGGCNVFYIVAGWIFIIISISYLPHIIIPLIIFVYFLTCIMFWVYSKLNNKKLLYLTAIILVAYLIVLYPQPTYQTVSQYLTALRECCGDRTTYNCDIDAIDNISCNLQWSNNKIPMRTLMESAGMSNENINGFCFCS